MEFANGFKMGGGGGGKKNSSTKNTKSSLLVPTFPVRSGTAASSVGREDRLNLQS